jgi:hypothetical protein
MADTYNPNEDKRSASRKKTIKKRERYMQFQANRINRLFIAAFSRRGVEERVLAFEASQNETGRIYLRWVYGPSSSSRGRRLRQVAGDHTRHKRDSHRYHQQSRGPTVLRSGILTKAVSSELTFVPRELPHR